MEEEKIYNTDILVEYNDNLEYRRCLRDVFIMNVSLRTIELQNTYGKKWVSFEDETKDELLFDENTSQRVIDHIYKLTHKIPEFKELYLKAAATMISEDLNLGLVILLSYDHFSDFHNCLVSFLTSNSLNDITLYWIQYLMKKFDKNT